MRNNYFSIIFLMFAAFIISACGGEGVNDNLDEQNEALEETPEGDTEGKINVGGSGTSTWIYGFLSSWSEVIENNSDYDFVVQSTAGSTAHYPMIDEGELDMGGGATPGEYFAEQGEAEFDKSYDSFNTILPISLSPGHIFTLEDSDIESIEDLEGVKLGTGARGSPTSFATEDNIESLGIEADYVNGDPDEMMDMLKDGRIDAVWYYAGSPWSALLDLSSQEDIKFISSSKDDIEKIKEENPYIVDTEIDAEDYDFLDENVTTPGFLQTIIVDENMEEDQVYDIVKSTWDNWEEIVDNIPAAGSVSIDDASDLQGVMHPGALRYYEEENIEIPEELK